MYFFILLQDVKILISNNKKSMYLPKVTTLDIFKLFKTEKSFINMLLMNCIVNISNGKMLLKLKKSCDE